VHGRGYGDLGSEYEGCGVLLTLVLGSQTVRLTSHPVYLLQLCAWVRLQKLEVSLTCKGFTSCKYIHLSELLPKT
jgi:hypothetical protein